MSAQTIARLVLARTRLGRFLGVLPLAEQAYARYALSRRHHPGIFSGIYRSYDAALAAIPRTRRSGWDNAESAAIWLDRPDPIAPSTYPLFFWLTQLLHPGATVVDFGGSIGLTYYGFQRLSRLPSDVRWIVVEVPHVVEQGNTIARYRSAPGLEFTVNLKDAPPGEILISAGALQYMRHSVPGLIEPTAAAPRHIILNKLPLTNGEDFWTLQNFGPAISPYRVFNRNDFLEYFLNAGYVVRDEWPVTDLSCDIPFHPRQNVPHFTGLYLERQSRAPQCGQRSLPSPPS